MTLRVLVLGGSDFIGLRLAERLERSGHQVTLADSRLPPCAEALHPTAVNLSSESALAPLITSSDVVVNCVAGKAGHILDSAHALFNTAQVANRPVVQVSTMAAYGSAEGHITEDSPLLGDVDDYAAARATVDRLAEQHDAIRLRPGIIYGPGSLRWTWQVGRLLKAHRLGDLGAAGDGICNLLYIDDLIDTLIQVLHNPSRHAGAYNLRGNELITWNEYFVRYARMLRAVPVRRLTMRRLKVETKMVAPPLKIASIVLGSTLGNWLPEMLPPSFLRACSQNIVLDTTKAKEQLNLQWTPLDLGLEHAASWFKQRVK